MISGDKDKVRHKYDRRLSDDKVANGNWNPDNRKINFNWNNGNVENPNYGARLEISRN